jgi:DNA-binding response OmpR family regulator
LSTHDDTPWPAALLPSPRRSEPDDRLHIDPRSRRVLRQGVAVDLTRLEFDLLLYLSTRPNRVHRRTLITTIRGVGYRFDDPHRVVIESA